jgi:hypothetical protein
MNLMIAIFKNDNIYQYLDFSFFKKSVEFIY